VPSELFGSNSVEQWPCISHCSGTAPGGGPPFSIFPEYVNQYNVTFQAVDLYTCPDSLTGESYLCSQSMPTVGTISPTGWAWENAGNPFEVAQTPGEGIYTGYGVGCGYSRCYWSSSTTDITFPSGCTHTTDDTCETEFTANSSGIITADFGMPDSGGSSPPSGCPQGSVMEDGGCACSGAYCDGLGDYGAIPACTGSSCGDPGYVLITAPDGISQIGCNATGDVVDTLLGGAVSTCAGGTPTILIADPAPGRYEIQVFSVGPSSSFNFTIFSDSLDGDRISATGLIGTATSGTPEVEYLTLGSGGCLSLSPSASSSGCGGGPGVGVPQFALAAPAIAAIGLLALVLVKRKSSPKIGISD